MEVNLIKVHFRALTGIRAIAAFLVYFHHVQPVGTPLLLKKLLMEFHIGVTFFFVLSGFLISYKYADNLNILSRSNFFRYMRNRFARVYPMFFIISILTFFINQNYNKREWLVNLTLTKGFFDDLKFSCIPQTWTLTVEETFYLLAPLIFLLNKKIKPILVYVIFTFIGVTLVLIFKNFSLFGFFQTLLLCFCVPFLVDVLSFS